MRIRMLIGTGGPNGTACEAGEVYDLPEPLAKSWVAAGRATVETDAIEVPVVVHGDPVPQATPAPVTRRRRVIA
jgi:hypothetical protein